MEILINVRAGSCFSVSKDACNLWFGFEVDPDIRQHFYKLNQNRTDPDIIAIYKEKGSAFVSNKKNTLALCYIPDDATDYIINNHNGAEYITYIQDGKVHHANSKIL